MEVTSQRFWFQQMFQPPLKKAAVSCWNVWLNQNLWLVTPVRTATFIALGLCASTRQCGCEVRAVLVIGNSALLWSWCLSILCCANCWPCRHYLMEWGSFSHTHARTHACTHTTTICKFSNRENFAIYGILFWELQGCQYQSARCVCVCTVALTPQHVV